MSLVAPHPAIPGDFGRFPAHPPSEVEWEELLARLEIAPRALRLAVDDSRAGRAALAAECADAVVADAWLGYAIDRLQHGTPLARGGSFAVPGSGAGDEADRALASFTRMRTRNFVSLQRRGIDVWAWTSPLDGASVTMHQVVAAVVDADGARLARVRALAAAA